MRRAPNRSRIRSPNRSPIALLVSLGLAACGDATRPAKDGTIQASSVTTGQGPSSYSLRVDLLPPHALGPNDSVTIAGVGVGTHSVALGGLPLHCQASGANPRPIVVDGGRVTRVSFAVSCTAVGSVEVTVRTTGTDEDPDGYEAQLKGVDNAHDVSLPLATNAGVTHDLIRAGTFDVTLQGVAENCAVGGGATRRVAVSSGVRAAVEFTVSCAPAALIAFVRGGRILVARSNGSGIAPITTGGQDSDPAWSPDGGRIAFSRNGVVTVMRADGTNVLSLTAGVQPAWSPDGRRLAAASGSYPSFVYTMSADARGPALSTVAANAYAPAWSPDGRRIAFVRSLSGDETDEIVIANPDGTNPVQITSGGGFRSRPAWSPDGLELAFTTCYESCVLHIASEDGRSLRPLSAGSGGYEVAWSPDGRTLAVTVCTAAIGGCPSIRYVRVDGSYAAMILTDGTGASWKP